MAVAVEGTDRLILQLPLFHEDHQLVQEVVVVPTRLYSQDLFAPAERRLAEEFKVEKRAVEWISGRMAAKEAVRLSLKRAMPYDRAPAHNEIIILPPEGERTGPPQVAVIGGTRPVYSSLSHSGGVAAAVAAMSTPLIGVDVEFIEPKNSSFLGEVFTPGEVQELSGIISDQVRMVEVVIRFSIKEAVMKAIGTGFNLDLHQVVVTGGVIDGKIFHAVALGPEAQQAFTFGSGWSGGVFCVGHDVIHNVFGTGKSYVVASTAFIQEGG